MGWEKRERGGKREEVVGREEGVGSGRKKWEEREREEGERGGGRKE